MSDISIGESGDICIGDLQEAFAEAPLRNIKKKRPEGRFQNLAADHCWSRVKVVLTTLQLPTSLTSRRGNYSCGLDLCLSPIRLLEMEGIQTAQHKRARL